MMLREEVTIVEDANGQEYLELEVEPMGRVYVKIDARSWSEIVDKTAREKFVDDLHPESE